VETSDPGVERPDPLDQIAEPEKALVRLVAELGHQLLLNKETRLRDICIDVRTLATIGLNPARACKIGFSSRIGVSGHLVSTPRGDIPAPFAVWLLEPQRFRAWLRKKRPELLPIYDAAVVETLLAGSR